MYVNENKIEKKVFNKLKNLLKEEKTRQQQEEEIAQQIFGMSFRDFYQQLAFQIGGESADKLFQYLEAVKKIRGGDINNI